MRRRRAHSAAPTEALNDTWSQVRNLIKQTSQVHAKLSQPDTEIPQVGDVKTLSEDELERLKVVLDSARTESMQALELWEQCERLAQDALDATNLALTLRVEPDLKKRRRTQGPEIQVGSKVAFRLPGTRPPNDEWILCEMTKVIQEGARYEVRDPEPDENHQAGKVYRANVRDMLAIPSPGSSLAPLAAGTQVLAQYPETTAFYRAEVTSCRGNKCRLIFEGEEETGKETEVERYLVLTFN